MSDGRIEIEVKVDLRVRVVGNLIPGSPAVLSGPLTGPEEHAEVEILKVYDPQGNELPEEWWREAHGELTAMLWDEVEDKA